MGITPRRTDQNPHVAERLSCRFSSPLRAVLTELEFATEGKQPQSQMSRYRYYAFRAPLNPSSSCGSW
jgi:hypothetical protein